MALFDKICYYFLTIMNSAILKKLEGFGLTQKEAATYIALLDTGAASARRISEITTLNRSTTYVQLTSLMRMGLVSSFKEYKKTKFAAESPQNLEHLLDRNIQAIENQKKQITSLLPELMQSYGKHGVTPIIRNFRGKDGLTAMREEIFQSTDEKIRIIMNYEELKRLYTQAELKAYSNKRHQQNILSFILYSKVSGSDFVPLSYQRLRRLSDTDKLFGCDVYIYGNTVSFAAMKHEVVGVSIDQKDIAQTMKTLFDTYWGADIS